jgi:hypothetical protein
MDEDMMASGSGSDVCGASSATGFFWPPRQSEVAHVQPTQQPRQNRPEDRSVPLPRADYGEHCAQPDSIADNAKRAAAGDGLKGYF